MVAEVSDKSISRLELYMPREKEVDILLLLLLLLLSQVCISKKERKSVPALGRQAPKKQERRRGDGEALFPRIIPERPKDGRAKGDKTYTPNTHLCSG